MPRLMWPRGVHCDPRGTEVLVPLGLELWTHEKMDLRCGKDNRLLLLEERAEGMLSWRRRPMGIGGGEPPSDACEPVSFQAVAPGKGLTEVTRPTRALRTVQMRCFPASRRMTDCPWACERSSAPQLTPDRSPCCVGCDREGEFRVREVFSEIYRTNTWTYGSGEGSLPIHTRGYVRYLQRFLSRNRVRSVLDFGCGDWQFSRLIDWSGVEYCGVDIVPEVVRRNECEFARENVRFAQFDEDPSSLPAADLLIVKDVLQHWPDEQVREFLPVIGRHRFALITNCVNPQGMQRNEDTAVGGFRYLDLRLAPFNLDWEEVCSFENHRSLLARMTQAPRWRKLVLLARSG